ncbi:Two-component response regulator [Hyphomicrobium sulfonivorans]|uniref:Two-component response regulator n=1 Tax=Hyphomicrobium sulfonivorans TaxID=121290 RepID=A0A109B8W6_HYPSL|nr:response regulator [Hyphomicrobium sulfonivorans]KWT64339.1 Two-component response regulator [Hyphomicrobium sulfonivorans]
MARILLADDDASTRDLVRRALEGDGHSVLVTQDGAEALEQLQAAGGGAGGKAGGHTFDVLVSDVEMPLLDGITLAEHALKQPQMRVLLMSGFSEQLNRARALAGTKLAVISKPFTLEDVRAGVRRLLG